MGLFSNLGQFNSGMNQIADRMDPGRLDARTAAWQTFNPNNLSANLSPELLKYGGRSPDGRYQISGEYSGGNAEFGEPGTLTGYNLWDLHNTGAGKPFYNFDANGKFLKTTAGASVSPTLALIPAAAALGMAQFLPGVAGAGAATGGATAAAPGIVDATAAGYGGLSAEGAATLGGGASVAGGAALPAVAGGTTAMGAGAGAGGVASTVGKALGGFSWDSLIGPGLSAVSGMYGSNQAGKAADAQIAAAREAQATLKPWTDAGGWAVGQAANMLGKNGATAAKNAFTMDPGYQFRLDQGNKALERAAAARGLGASGKYLKDAMAYNQGQASQEFTNSYNRLTNLAGLGQTSANNSADYGTQAGNAAAAGRIGSANAFTNALGQGYSMYANSQQQNANNNILAQVLSRRY